jgi:L-alanine-DL-glutamate epimerase-like enolase superfamily enzyme
MKLCVSCRTYPLKRPFKISRASKTDAQVIEISISHRDAVGYAECVPYQRYGESIESVTKQLEALDIPHHDTLQAITWVNQYLPAGAARNAIDCALWGLHAQLLSKPLGQCPEFYLQLPAPYKMPDVIQTCRTISVDTLDVMRQELLELGQPAWLKIKLDRQDIVDKITMFRAIAPHASLVVDANEAWDIALLNHVAPQLQALGVILIEQPVPSGEDAALSEYCQAVPICADESCHTSADIQTLSQWYQYMNIKLDKSGGLSEAIAMVNTCRQLNKRIMLGCMVGSSLAMAPSVWLSQYADVIDLDGPALLARDRECGFVIKGSDFATRNNTNSKSTVSL